MRSAPHHRSREEEEESVFVSMTDVTVSFLFIVILLLAFFASQYPEERVVPQSRYDAKVAELATVEAEREQLRDVLALRTAEIDELRRELSVVRAERDEARAQLELRDLRIVELERQNAELQVQVTDLQRTINELQEQVTILQQTIIDLEARIEALETQAEQLRVEIARLEALLAEAQTDPLEEYLRQTATRRTELLELVRDRLLALAIPGIQVSITADALSIAGEEGLFDTAQATLRADREAVVSSIARTLNEILPCFTIGPLTAWNPDCNPSAAVIEAVQIEGHTDSVGDDPTNLALSTARANATFLRMVEFQPDLTAHRNLRDQPVLSVAGYGEMRPIATNETAQGRATNRRIDLRIIMVTPEGLEDIARIRERLGAPAQ